MDDLIGLVILGFMLYFAIICHELAHAFVIVRRGYRISSLFFGFPTIKKVIIRGVPIRFGLIPYLGGTIPRARYIVRASPKDKILVSPAGPAANLFIALVLFLVLFVPPFLGVHMLHITQTTGKETSILRDTAHMIRINGVAGFLIELCTINLLLGLLNLIPLPPFDGGHIATALVVAVIGKKAKKWVTVFTVVCAVVVSGFLIYTSASDAVQYGAHVYRCATHRNC